MVDMSRKDVHRCDKCNVRCPAEVRDEGGEEIKKRERCSTGRKVWRSCTPSLTEKVRVQIQQAAAGQEGRISVEPQRLCLTASRRIDTGGRWLGGGEASDSKRHRGMWERLRGHGARDMRCVG